jgi:hypothetical protein
MAQTGFGLGALHYVIDTKASQFTVQAFASGLISVVAHSPKIVVRDWQGEVLQGVSYDLKDSGKHEIGVIAEEVGAVVPEVVSYEENGKDARGVDYSRLTALLIEAVKQQQREILDLKSELRATRQTLQKVKAQMTVAQPTAVAAK